MSSRHLFASSLLACLLVVGLPGIAPVANTAAAAPSFLVPGNNAGNNVVEIKNRGRDARTYLSIAPSYLYYDYPYYYSRGYYPTHIQPGFIYNGYPYSYYKSRYYYRKYRARAHKN